MAIDKVLRGIPFLRQELTKIFMKRAADKSGIMQIPFKNKKLQLDIEDRLQKYISDAQKQGVDLDMVSNENLKYTINLNENVDPLSRAISADSPEGRKITEALLGKQKAPVVDINTGKIMDTSQGIMGGKSVKELMKSGQVTKGTKGLKKSKKVEDREMFEGANQRLRGPVKGKMDMGEFGKVDVETDYSAAINRKEFFDTKAKNMYDKTVKTGPEFFKAQKEQILNTINRKKKEMVPPTHSNYKLLKKSLQDQEDALEAIKITEDLGGNENMFNYLRTQNIADYKSKPIKRSNYVRNETEQEIADRLNKQNQDSLQNLKNKLDDPEDMADGGVAGLLGERTGYQDGLKVYPKITASKTNQGLGNGKNVDLQELTYGGTLMYDQGPFSAGIEYLKGKDKFDFKDIDDTLAKDTTDRELANLILMMKLKNGLIKFKGNKDNQMINISKSFAQGGPARTGYASGNGVADGDAEKAALGKRVRQLMDEEGYDFGEAVRKAMEEGYADGGPARQNFVMGKRAFLKLMGGVGAGIAGLKSGLLGLGKGATKKAVTETVKQTAGSGTPPPYFFKLVEKIKTLGNDVGATQDRQIAKSMKSKDGKSEYLLEEDVTTGDTIIKKISKEDDRLVSKVEIMQHNKNQADELTKGKKPKDTYEEVTEYNSRIYKDDYNPSSYEDGINQEGISEIVEEAGVGFVKKADGGLAAMLGE